jgi:hypothetical protein
MHAMRVRREDITGRCRAHVALIVGGVAACLLIGAHSAPAENAVASIVALCSERVHSYGEMVGEFKALERTGRVKVVTMGQTAQGRPIPVVALFHPQTKFGTTARLFIIARQHGTERASTETCLALVRHFAESQAPEDIELLRKLTIVCVPMANPDGAENSRRCNANGVDLNRNWDSCSQPETAAIAHAVRLWQPDAVMDLHELPADAPKPSYRDNFMECIGQSPSLSPELCATSAAISKAITQAMARCEYPLNVYYDFPGESPQLCHKRFGLKEGIPSFLCEAKTGGGRSMQYRVGFQTVAVMVAALTLVNETLPGTAVSPKPYWAGAGGAATTPKAPPPATVAPIAPRRTALRVSLPETISAPSTGRLEIAAEVQEGDSFGYISFVVDGKVRALTNRAPFVYSLDVKPLSDGRHVVCVQAMNDAGGVVDEKTCTLLVGNRAEGE